LNALLIATALFVLADQSPCGSVGSISLGPQQQQQQQLQQQQQQQHEKYISDSNSLNGNQVIFELIDSNKHLALLTSNQSHSNGNLNEQSMRLGSLRTNSSLSLEEKDRLTKSPLAETETENLSETTANLEKSLINSTELCKKLSSNGKIDDLQQLEQTIQQSMELIERLKSVKQQQQQQQHQAKLTNGQLRSINSMPAGLNNMSAY
jgi:sigma54-dependent transcription regulator